MSRKPGPETRPLPVGDPLKPDRPSPAVPSVRAGRSRMVDNPQPGYFLIRVVKGGPWVPARIVHDFGHWWAEINGREVGKKTEDPLTADQVLRIWHFGREIDQNEYRRLLRIPAAERPDPTKPVDLSKKRSLF